MFQAVSGRGQIRNNDSTTQLPTNPVARCAHSCFRLTRSSTTMATPATKVFARWAALCGQTIAEAASQPPSAVFTIRDVSVTARAVAQMGPNALGAGGQDLRRLGMLAPTGSDGCGAFR